MKTYNVIIETQAAADMLELRRYISKTLKEPETAKRVYASLKTALLSLCQNPERQPLVRDEPYASLGIRRLRVENHTAFYLVNEAAGEVRILRVLYSRRVWQHLL